MSPENQHHHDSAAVQKVRSYMAPSLLACLIALACWVFVDKTNQFQKSIDELTADTKDTHRIVENLDKRLIETMADAKSTGRTVGDLREAVKGIDTRFAEFWQWRNLVDARLGYSNKGPR